MNSETITPPAKTNAARFGSSSAKSSKNASKKSAIAAVANSDTEEQSEKMPDFVLKQRAAPIPIETVFRLIAPEADQVLLVGEFSNWCGAPIKMIKGNRGVWRAMVPLFAGRHPYRFVVDGEWQNDPDCTELVPNGFGSFNNMVEVK